MVYYIYGECGWVRVTFAWRKYDVVEKNRKKNKKIQYEKLSYRVNNRHRESDNGNLQVSKKKKEKRKEMLHSN